MKTEVENIKDILKSRFSTEHQEQPIVDFIDFLNKLAHVDPDQLDVKTCENNTEIFLKLLSQLPSQVEREIEIAVIQFLVAQKALKIKLSSKEGAKKRDVEEHRDEKGILRWILYRSKQGNSNDNFNCITDYGRCRQFSDHFIKNRKTYSEDLSSLDNIEKNLKENKFDTERKIYKAKNYELFDLSRLGYVLKQAIDIIERHPGLSPKECSFLFHSENHTMGISIEKKKIENSKYECWVLRFYDPNTSTEHFRGVFSTVDAITEIDIKDFLSADNIKTYFARGKVGMLAAYTELPEYSQIDDATLSPESLFIALEFNHASYISKHAKTILSSSYNDQRLLFSAKRHDGTSGLYWSLREGHTEVVKLFVELIFASDALNNEEKFKILDDGCNLYDKKSKYFGHQGVSDAFINGRTETLEVFNTLVCRSTLAHDQKVELISCDGKIDEKSQLLLVNHLHHLSQLIKNEFLNDAQQKEIKKNFKYIIDKINPNEIVDHFESYFKYVDTLETYQYLMRLIPQEQQQNVLQKIDPQHLMRLAISWNKKDSSVFIQLPFIMERVAQTNVQDLINLARHLVLLEDRLYLFQQLISLGQTTKFSPQDWINFLNKINKEEQSIFLLQPGILEQIAKFTPHERVNFVKNFQEEQCFNLIQKLNILKQIDKFTPQELLDLLRCLPVNKHSDFTQQPGVLNQIAKATPQDLINFAENDLLHAERFSFVKEVNILKQMVKDPQRLFEFAEKNLSIEECFALIQQEGILEIIMTHGNEQTLEKISQLQQYSLAMATIPDNGIMAEATEALPAAPSSPIAAPLPHGVGCPGASLSRSALG